MSDTATTPARTPIGDTAALYGTAPAGWAADWTPAQRQRAAKVTRQLDAIARLIDNAPAGLGDAPWDPKWVAASQIWPTYFSSVDTTTRWLSERIVALHAWRGHTASLPADQRPVATS